ncbi:MAG: leucine-rich repeat protein, partial [Clostridia bacterium]|nr:leucine-rich repeat protein [Clostridia bacterium]
MKKVLSLVLAFVFVVGICASAPIAANAASTAFLTFELNVDGQSYSVTDCIESASGEIVIPNAHWGLPVTGIGRRAFSSCDYLTSVTIPDSVTSIGGDAFWSCDSLTSVYITDIASWYNIYFADAASNPLYYAKKLYLNGELVTDLTIPESVTEIKAYVFYNYTSLTSVTIPDSVTSIGEDAFYNTGYYNDDSNWENNVLYIGKHLIEAKEEISGAYTIKSGTKTIADYAFCNCPLLTSVTIPGSVTSIAAYAFSGCTSLTSITIPDSVTSIGSCAFEDCTSLTSIIIPDGVISIDWCTFSGCKSLTSITIPGSVTEIEGNAFRDCSSLRSVTIPDSVTSIGEYAFYYCSSLTSVTIGDSVTSIGYDAFVNCSSLTSITIPDSVTNIGSSAFSNTGYYNDDSNWENGVLYIGKHLIEAKKEISGAYTIKSGTKTIADCAFYYCTSLTSITISDSVTSIGDQAFYGCTSLTSITIPDSVTSIDWYAFEDCTSLTSITIPGSVTSISSYAFDGCTSLTSVTIGNGVTSIGNRTFFDCKALKSVTIPDSVTSIGNWALGYYWDSEIFEYYKIYGFTIYGVKGSEAEIYANENDFTFVEVVPHTHTYTESITKQPTCTEAGEKTFTCSCGDSYTTPVAALGHDYSNEYTVDKAPTYDEEGSESRHCTRCDAKTGERAIPKLVRLSAPTILTTESTENGVKFTWSAVEGADGYTVFKLTKDATGNYVYKELATVGKATFAFTDKTAVDGETYCYAVCAMDNYGATSPYAEFAFTYVKPIPLSTPVVKTANTAKGIKVTWNKVANAQKYVVYRKFYSPKNKKWSGWIALNSNCKTTSFVDTTTKLGINYRYTVKAVNGKSASAFKSTATIKYNVTPVVKVANASNGIKVSWSTVANATGYTVYSSTYNTKTKKWSSWKNRGTAGKNKTSWVDKKAKPGTVYKYTVRAVCGSNASSFKASSSLVRLLNPTVKAV